MRKISKDEFEKLDGHGRGSTGPFYNRLLELEVDQGIEVKSNEWLKKYPPSITANRIMKRYSRVFKWKALPDRTGWWFLRVK